MADEERDLKLKKILPDESLNYLTFYLNYLFLKIN